MNDGVSVISVTNSTYLVYKVSDLRSVIPKREFRKFNY